MSAVKKRPPSRMRVAAFEAAHAERGEGRVDIEGDELRISAHTIGRGIGRRVAGKAAPDIARLGHDEIAPRIGGG